MGAKIVYKSTETEQLQLSFFRFNASCGMQLDSQNEWMKKAISSEAALLIVGIVVLIIRTAIRFHTGSHIRAASPGAGRSGRAGLW